MPKMRNDLNDPKIQEEIRQSEEIDRMRAEISKKLDERTEKQKIKEWNIEGSE